MAILTDEGIKEALNKKMMNKEYVNACICPECNGEGKFYLPNGETKACQSCNGVGYLERVSEATNVKADPTNPDHYKNSTSLECIEAMEIIFGINAVVDFCVCNAWKYIWRWKNKNGAEDLDKARWYICKARELIDYNDLLSAKNRYMDILLRMNDYIDDIERNWKQE